MATTAILPIHAGKGRPVATALKMSVDYIKNPDKTDHGQWPGRGAKCTPLLGHASGVTAYACDPLIADEEFLFAKNQYAAITGRDQGKRDVLAYHLRISFKPGEVDAETANRIGYDLAMKLTHGKNAFVCCTHLDRAHVHTQIVINSTNIDCTGKFRNFKRSSFAVRRIADQLCVENGLSIIENPNPSKGKNYGKWLGDDKPTSGRGKLRDLIDENLVTGNSLEDFITKLMKAGVEVKHGKQFSFRPPGSKRFFRQDSLGEDYSFEAIQERLVGRRTVAPRSKIAEPPKSVYAPKLLIDIEEKLKQGYGAGFERYARIQNIKEAAKTLIFLKENGIGTYEELVKKEASISGDYNSRNERRKEIDARLAEITELQKHIGNYGKSQAVFAKYKASKFNQDFFEANRQTLTLRKAAKDYFDKLGIKKLPTIATLKQEYATLLAEKKTLGDIKAARADMIDWTRAKHNVDSILGEQPPGRKKTHERDAL